MERNVDKIKRLEKDAEKYRARFLAQEKDLDKLRFQLENARRGSREIQELVDALMITVVLTHGTEQDGGSRTLKIPVFDILQATREHELKVMRDDARMVYVLSVAASGGPEVEEEAAET